MRVKKGLGTVVQKKKPLQGGKSHRKMRACAIEGRGDKAGGESFVTSETGAYRGWGLGKVVIKGKALT